LIRGDALHVLNALISIPEFAREYVGKVKLVYIDPPFNTGQAFEHYDDGLEHSVWLTMLRDRLVQIKELMSPDGSVWVHVDDGEMHRCRAVLDEVFGSDNFVGCVVWEKADSARNDAKRLSTDQDYILVYAKTKEDWEPNRTARTAEMNAIYSSPDADETPWFDDNPTAPGAKTHQGMVYAIQSPFTGELQYPAPGRHWFGEQERLLSALLEWAPYERRDIGDAAERARRCDISENEVRLYVPALMLALPLHEARAKAQKRYEAGSWPELIFRSGGQGGIGHKRYQPETGLAPRTLWLSSDVGHNRTAKAEIKALFPGKIPFSTPKPERLLQRIIRIATGPGDIVLDCFVGSGTTAAVAHKLGRRWIASEWSAQTMAQFTLPRLTRVVSGADHGGVSTAEVPVTVDENDEPLMRPGAGRAAAKTLEALLKAGAFDASDGPSPAQIKSVVKALRKLDRTRTEVLWSGGGGFRVLEVGPSMFEAIGGRIYLADWAVNGALSEAVAAQLGYDYKPDGPFSGAKGKTRLAVVDGLVNEGVIRLLVDALPEHERLLVCGTAIDPECRALLKQLRPGSTIKKVPAAILDDYRTRRRDRLALASVLDWSQASKMIDFDTGRVGTDREPIKADSGLAK